uniref:Methyltransferase n=1 Tax=viral metagenome TaxID=1070528 RepID=A0A6C0B4N6_9ZZZZ
MLFLKPYGSVAYSSFETICNSYDMTTHILNNNIQGCIVECGVAAGAQLGAIHRCCIDNRQRRAIYGFDSFEGIPIASRDDDEQPGIGTIKEHVPYTNTRELLKSSGITVCPLDSVERIVKNWFPQTHTDFKFIKGWFQDTVVGFNEPIALLRLDGDLYESTRVCLENLYPLLQPGGILIIDDWALGGCQKACREYFANCSVEEIEPVHKTPGPKYFKKLV